MHVRRSLPNCRDLLFVLVPPTITTGLTNQSALVESSVTLSCEASGTPPLTWSWRRGSELVTEGVSSTGNRTELTVTNVQTMHANIYQCIISHDTAGSAASASVLLVEGLCVCVCVCVCMQVRSVYLYVCKSVYTYVCVCIHAFICPLICRHNHHLYARTDPHALI